MLLATNGGILLEKDVKDEAFYRRTIVIPFVKSMPLNEIMPDMAVYLQQEKSAILSRAARKMKDIIDDDGGILFPESPLSKKIKAMWSGESSYAKEFMEENLEFTGDPEDALPKEDIYRQYREYFRGLSGNMIMCTKDELMRKIISNYPGVTAKKLRRAGMEDMEEVKLRPCLTGLQWKSGSNWC